MLDDDARPSSETTQHDSDRYTTLNIMLGGFIAALVILPSERLSFVPQVLGTLVHELGHAATAWLFGYPAVPALDFVYGGGVTLHQDRSPIVLVLVYGLAAGGLYWLRRDLVLLGSAAMLVLAHILCAATRAHYALFLLMGHGFELVFAGIFLYRALTGSAVVHRIERPMYAFLGFFLVFFNTRFAFRLLTDPSRRAEYEQGKGGGHWMDFSRLSEQVFHVDLSTVAAGHLVLSGVPIVAALLAYRYRQALARLADRILTAGTLS